MLVALAVLVTPEQVTAQDAISLIYQTEDYTFGQALNFTVEAQATTIFTDAQLTVRPANHPEFTVEMSQLARSARLSLTEEVDVLAHGIPPFAEITYHWELTTFGDASLTTPPRTFRYADNRLGWPWQSEQSENVIVHWDGEDTGVAQIALDVAQDSLARTHTLLGTSDLEDIHVYVYPELEQLTSGLRLHNRNIQDWVTALALPDQSVILLSATSGPQLFVDLSRDLPHELTHIVIYRAAGDQAANIPAWYNEGLAILSSAEPDAALRVTLESGVRDNTLLPLESLCAESYAALQPADAALAYAQSESVMRYIQDHFGSDGVRNLLTTYADGASCDMGVERALGISLDDLETRWQADLSHDMLTQNDPVIALLPWAALLGLSILLALLLIVPPNRTATQEPADTLPQAPQPLPLPTGHGDLPEAPKSP
jgi:hypothetical protein